MTLYSILFVEDGGMADDPSPEVPAYFRDLNLDQIVDAVTAEWKEYRLEPFFYTPLQDKNAVLYRQEVMQDILDWELVRVIAPFSAQMRKMRVTLKGLEQLGSKYASERRFLAAVELYCTAVRDLLHDLDACELRSRGLKEFREHLTSYVSSESFKSLDHDLEKVESALSSIRFSLRIGGDSVSVARSEPEKDLSLTVEETFAKFRHDHSKEVELDIPRWGGMNHVESRILERLALLYPEAFSALDNFHKSHAGYLESGIARFDREIQFYVAYLSYIDRFRADGMQFCLPEFSDKDKHISASDTFDLALAAKLMDEERSIVTNDLRLSGPERLFVVTGPNHGGKTTFARTFGQLHHLAALGCPVPAAKARLFLFDQIFAHFEREENAASLRGKLQDDLIRIHDILEKSTGDSIIIMNELFSSTTLHDAVLLSQRVMKELSRKDIIGVWVTFLDELASYNEKTVSLVAMVDPQDLSERTFKLERKPANGLAYALAIAEKHGVTYDRIMKRVKT